MTADLLRSAVRAGVAYRIVPLNDPLESRFAFMLLTNHTVDLVSLLEEQLRQVGAILPRNPGNKRFLHESLSY